MKITKRKIPGSCMNDSQHAKLRRRLAFESSDDDSSVFQVLNQLTPAFKAGRAISCDDHVILRKAFRHCQL